MNAMTITYYWLMKQDNSKTNIATFYMGYSYYCKCGQAVSLWLTGYGTKRKFFASSPDEVIDVFKFTYFFQPHYALEFNQPPTVINTIN
jgi:hypothetical protein